jgi:hypothetical protein
MTLSLNMAKLPQVRGQKPQLRQIFLSLFLTVTLFIVYGFLDPALAHNPTGGVNIRVNDQKIGPYILLVATYPQPAIVGQMDVWVRVGENGTNRFLRDAVVTIEAKPRNGGRAQIVQASHDLAGNPVDYLAHLDLESAGPWEFTVKIESDLGPANVAFTDSVAWLSAQLLVELALIVVVWALLLGIYLWRQTATLSLELATPE